MSAESVRLVLHTIADDLLALASRVLDDDTVSNNTKVAKNTLRDSALRGDLAATISQTNGDDAVIKTLFNHYVVYLEWDRPKKHGKQPPPDVLKAWAEKNGIPTDANTLWAISYVIWRDGHVGRPIFATMDAQLDGLFLDDWADKLFAAIITELDNFFA